MLIAAQLLAASSVLGAASLEYGVRTEADSRTAYFQGQNAQTAVDLAVAPRLALLVDDKLLRLNLTYVPRLAWVDVDSGAGPDFSQSLGIVAKWAFEHGWQLGGVGNATYGTTNFLSLPVTAPLPGQSFQVVPTLITLRYLHVDVGGSVTGDLTRHLIMTTSLSYSIDGGADADSQKTLPLLGAVRLGWALDWRATRDGLLGTALDLQEAELNNGRHAITGVALLSWREHFGAESDWWIGGGAGAYYEAGGGLASSSGVLPAGKLGYQHTSILRGADISEEGEKPIRVEQHFVQRIELKAEPYFDRLTGQVYDLVDLIGSANWALSDRWTLTGSLDGGIAVRTGEEPASAVTLDLRATWKPGKVDFTGGARGVWQRDLRISPDPIKQLGFFLAIGFGNVQKL